jgi:hypothetical protein
VEKSTKAHECYVEKNEKYTMLDDETDSKIKYINFQCLFCHTHTILFIYETFGCIAEVCMELCELSIVRE